MQSIRISKGSLSRTLSLRRRSSYVCSTRLLGAHKREKLTSAVSYWKSASFGRKLITFTNILVHQISMSVNTDYSLNQTELYFLHSSVYLKIFNCSLSVAIRSEFNLVWLIQNTFEFFVLIGQSYMIFTTPLTYRSFAFLQNIRSDMCD